MQELPTELRQLVDRVRAGHCALLRDSPGRVARDDVVIVVGPELWDILMDFSRRSHEDSTTLMPIEYDFAREAVLYPARVFGYRIKQGESFMPKQMSFRWEMAI